jgi:inner membrane protein
MAAGGTQTISLRLLAVGIACSVLPDVDVIGFRAGIPYGAVLGHRGFTHSFVFAILVAALVCASSSSFRASRGTVFLFILVCIGSHGLLDALTTGGLGVAFFSPFSNHRYFLPWRVIEVSPIGIAPFFSRWGLRVLLSELQWVWAPSFVIGFVGCLIHRGERFA